MVIKITTEPPNIGNFVEKLLSGLTTNIVEEGLKSISERIRNTIQGKSPVGIGETSGNFKRAWSGLQKVSGGYAWSNPMSYGGTLEEGLYTGVGRRTAIKGTGIYSKQAIGGILQPLVDDDSFVNSIVQAIVDKLLIKLERGSV